MGILTKDAHRKILAFERTVLLKKINATRMVSEGYE